MIKKKASETHSKRCLSVKPTLEQERDLQLIEAEEGTTRSTMMREALKDYLTHKRLKKVGRSLRKDHTQALIEEALEEQLTPLKKQIESISTSLQTLAQTLSKTTTDTPPTGILSLTGKPGDVPPDTSLGRVLALLEVILKLLEQNFQDTLVTQTIAVNFLFEQLIRNAKPNETECLKLIERAVKPAAGRSEITTQVFSIIRDQMNGVAFNVSNDYRAEAGVERIVQRQDQGEARQISGSETVAVP